MGGGRTRRDQPGDRPETRRRVTVREAAEALGITVEAVRGRIKRGTLGHHKAPDGTVYVWIEGDQTVTGHQPDDNQPTDDHDRARDQPRPDDRPDELIEELRDRIAYLERQVEEEREARRRADTLMARLMDRVPELEAASPPEPRDEPESATEAEAATSTPPDQSSPQTATQRRPSSWWRRLIGG